MIKNETLFQIESDGGNVWLLAQIKLGDSRAFQGNSTNDFVLNLSNHCKTKTYAIYVTSIFISFVKFEIKSL